MLPDFPKAKDMILKWHEQFFEARLKSHLGPLFGDISKKPMYEGSKMEHNYQEGFTYNNDLIKMETGFEILVADLKKNPLAIFDKLDEMAADLARQQQKMTLDTISEITAMTGNVIDGTGEITPEQILQIWEKMEIEFNEDGTPVNYSIVAGPETLDKMKAVFDEMEKNELYKSKMKELMDIKRKAWHDRENNRKLVG